MRTIQYATAYRCSTGGVRSRDRKYRMARAGNDAAEFGVLVRRDRAI